MRLPILLCGFLFAVNMTAQISQCEVWQYFGTDSAGKTLAKLEKYDAKGQLVYEKSNGWKYSANDYPGTYESFYEYSDTLLVKMTSVFDKDSSRIEFEYDSAGRRVRQHNYIRRYVMQDTVKSGMFTISTVDVDSTANKWVHNTDGTMTYDRWGRIISDEFTALEYGHRFTYTWAYDEQGRIVRLAHSVNGTPRTVEQFKYTEGGYRSTKTYYDGNGKVIRKPGKKNPSYMQRKYYTVKLDAQGHETEERISNAKDEQIERTVRTYNAQGKIAREVCYGAGDKVEMTHVYVYR